MTAPAPHKDLVAILRETQVLLALPGNDFRWSSWAGAEQGLQEISGHITGLETGEPPRRLRLENLFAPTGPLQEVSVSSGWAQEFLGIARRFDAALTLRQ